MGTIERTSILLTLVAVAGLTAYVSLRAMEDDKKRPVEDRPPAATAAPRPNAKPLSEHVKKGIDYLIEHQLPNGGWAQGEQAVAMRGGDGEPATVANVGDTCIAALALIRAGNTPKEGAYAKNVARAVAFVTAQVEKSAADDLSVTDVKNTRLQGKLGPYVDTFLTSMLLAEVKGKMPDAASEKSTVVALDRVIHKITKNQKADGTWTDAGWAPVLAQSLAGKGLNRAAQNGAKVDDRVLALAEKNARESFRPATESTAVASLAISKEPASRPARFAGGLGGIATTEGGGRMAGDANVPLYGFAANAAAGQDAINTRKLAEADLKKVADDPKTPKEERERAQTKLKDLETNAKAQEQATKAIVERLGDKQFVQGFGSNGGEEFLSYMQISETLLAKGGKEWQDWDKSMTENLGRIQNADGSWSGHHCITGRTFCTATALLVLMADRAPLPTAPKPDAKK
jgi:hypothetical protein